MGVIDPQVVLEKSKAGKRALDGLREYVATRQKLLSRCIDGSRAFIDSLLQLP